MEESEKNELQEIFQMFDEASIANKKYLLGYAEGFLAGIGTKS